MINVLIENKLDIHITFSGESAAQAVKTNTLSPNPNIYKRWKRVPDHLKLITK